MEYTLRVRLKRVELAAAGTSSFYFEKPAGFDYQAGQFIEMTLPGAEGEAEEDHLHSFSLASAPGEEDLMITTRLRDTVFKHRLRNLNPGDEVAIEGPYGTFTLREDTPRPLVYIAGGVGITPVRSMLLEAAAGSELRDVLLFYSNRTPRETAFLDELAMLEQAQPGFKLIATMTGLAEDDDWPGERGRLDIDKLRRFVDPQQATFYVSGPPPLVDAMRSMLSEGGVERRRIRAESFDGY